MRLFSPELEVTSIFVWQYFQILLLPLVSYGLYCLQHIHIDANTD